ncbi:MAG: A/G-specific adenine glycosylase [Lentimonas sp.]|jgi:A/G-specific adenine glycosylase
MPPILKPVAFQRALADWYADAQRPLPWRMHPSLYRTVVSEFMLQQTQIKTMLPYYHRWLQRFPNFEALAAASADAVLKHWEGLGYYSRARNFHKLAQAYVGLTHKPQTALAWRELPGIGPYTSAAISSIAQGHPTAVVDGNVVRILARLTQDERTFKNNGEAVKAFTATAQELLDLNNPGDHNQAMMELGATLCTKRNPLCHCCPVLKFCAANATGEPEALPKIQRKATEKVSVDRLWIEQDAQLLLHRIPDDAAQLAGQYELPSANAFSDFTPESHTALTTRTRSITHRRITERIYKLPPSALRLENIAAQQLHWLPFARLKSITLSGPHRRWIEELMA